MAPAAGTSFGPYTVVEQLGTGGMGAVYKARDRRLGREVALKVLHPDKLSNTERRERFLQEARTASALNHPNIVQIYDIGNENGVDYIAMEYVHGRTLDQVIPRNGLRLNETLRYSIAVADALAKAHAAGIVHRDLKPANVMVDAEGRVKLLDFGLAKLAPADHSSERHEHTKTMQNLTVEGTILGTVSYMSPEQATGKVVDARSDIFSFGVLLYEMITGRRAFHSDSPVATMSAILREEPARAGTVVEGVPPELERVVFRCMRKDPERRWQSMKDVKVALEELKEESDSGSLLSSTAAAVVAAAPAPTRRRIAPALILAGGIVGVAAGGAVFWLRTHQPPPAAEQQVQTSAANPAVPAAAPVAPPAEKPPSDLLTNDHVIEMVKAKLSTAMIESHIREGKNQFDLSPDAVVKLAQSGVPERLIALMRNPAMPAPATAAPVKPAVTAPATLPVVTQTPAPKTVTPPTTALVPAPAVTPVAPPPVVVPPSAFETKLVRVPEGRPVALSLNNDFSAAESLPPTIDFTVSQDLIIDGVVVIAKGAGAKASVMESEKRRIFRGKESLVGIRMESVTSADGKQIPIRFTVQRGGPPVRIFKRDKAALSKGAAAVAYISADNIVAVKVPRESERSRSANQ